MIDSVRNTIHIRYARLIPDMFTHKIFKTTPKHTSQELINIKRCLNQHKIFDNALTNPPQRLVNIVVALERHLNQWELLQDRPMVSYQLH